jgi:immune inhibitor A
MTSLWLLPALFIVLLSFTLANAVPPSPELLKELKESGQLQKFVDRFAEAKSRGFDVPNPSISSKNGRSGQALSFDPAVRDTFKVLIILADFSDQPASDGTINAQPSDFDHLLLSHNEFDYHYSMAEFYMDNSYGNFYIEGLVLGWYRMPETYAYYVDGQNGFGSYPRSADGMVEDAVLMADADVDFSEFDTDNNGYIDGLFMVHSGPGAEQTGSDDDIWSHMGGLHTSLFLDGVTIQTYTMQPEEDSDMGLTTMGVFSHEYGHFLGLPDLYDYDHSSAGVGSWSLMAGGSWNYSGRYPAFMDAWCKSAVGFLDPIRVTSNMTDVEIPSSYYNPVAYRVWANGSLENQYFLVENRQKIGNDKGIGGSGLLILHVDESIWSNDDETHPHVAVEQADGRFDLESDINNGDGGDVWSTATKSSFDDLTTPSTRTYSGLRTKTAVWDISDADSIMTASLDISYSRPLFELLSWDFSDTEYGNDNGIAEAGETIILTFSVQNLWLQGTNVTGTLSADNPEIVLDIPSVNIGTVSGDGSSGGNTSANPIVFTVPADFAPCIDSFFLDVTSDISGGDATFGMMLQIGSPRFLIVDDDNGGSYEQKLQEQFYNRGLPFDIWNTNAYGSPTVGTLSAYEAVMWVVGDARPTILSSADIAALEGYMDNGGNLFLSGQAMIGQLSSSDPTFLNDYLRASFGTTIYFPVHNGEAGSPTGDGIKLVFENANNQTEPQTMVNINGSIADFTINPGGVTGLTYDGTYRLVLLSFGFEALSSNYEPQGYASRDTLFQRILDFFSDEAASQNPVVTSLEITGATSYDNIVNHTPEFTWTVSDTTPNAVAEYEVEVGTGQLCSNHNNRWAPLPYTGSGTSVTYAGDPLEDGYGYVAQVRVFNGVTWSNWKALPFRMNTPPVGGDIVEPSGDEQVNSATPALGMDQGTDADDDDLTYDFEVYSDEGLSTMVASGTGVPPGVVIVIWNVTSPLAEDQRFFWRGRAYDGYEYSDFTDAESFYVNAINQAPASFSLIDPPNADTCFDEFPRFYWHAAPDTDPSDMVLYTLWTSLDPTFAVHDETPNLPDTVLSVTYPMATDTVYYWKVKAADMNGGETWSSETFSFLTPVTIEPGCCVDTRGNVNNDPEDQIDISDLTYFVDFMFSGGSAPECFEEGDVNSDESHDISDITFMVDYFFGGGPAPGPCP